MGYCEYCDGTRVQGDAGTRTGRDVTQARRRMRDENTASDLEILDAKGDQREFSLL